MPGLRCALNHIFMDDPSYLKITEKEPHWKELPCEACERKRFLRETEEKAETQTSRN